MDEFAKEANFDSASFFMATPCVGSELLKICEENNFLKKDFGYANLKYKVGNISTPDFTSGEVEDLVKVFNKEFNKSDNREKHFAENKY